MFWGGIIGTVGCIILLFFLPRIFAAQRRKMHGEIEREEKENG